MSITWAFGRAKKLCYYHSFNMKQRFPGRSHIWKFNVCEYQSFLSSQRFAFAANRNKPVYSFNWQNRVQFWMVQAYIACQLGVFVGSAVTRQASHSRSMEIPPFSANITLHSDFLRNVSGVRLMRGVEFEQNSPIAT